MHYRISDTQGGESTTVERSDAIGESANTRLAQSSGEKGNPISEKLTGSAELVVAVGEQERIITVPSSRLLGHGGG